MAMTKFLIAGFFSAAAFWGSAAIAQAPSAPAAEALPTQEKQPAKQAGAVEDKKQAKAPEKAKKAAPAYIRIRRADDKRKTPLAMETAVISFASSDAAKNAGVTIDLVGAVHVGEPEYYAELNQLFTSYDALLYELVAPEGTKITKEQREKSERSAHPIALMQNGLSSVLELKHQLNCIDYTAANFVHADMSPDEFNKSMENNNESWSKMFFTMMGQGIAVQAKNKGEDPNMDIMFAFMSNNRAQKLKTAFAKQFENMDGQLDAIGGEKGSTIINARNGKAMEVLSREIAAGKKKIGIFYGAGHLGDMESRLQKDFQFARNAERWIMAWDLKKPEKDSK